jgi:class 3 adenylate cyclase
MDQPKRILVVDDDGDVREMIAEYLSAAGFRVSTADSAASMRRALALAPVDLVLLDRTMPDGDGLRAIPELRQHAAVIVVTALAQDDERVRGLDSGADDYICKPFNWRELISRIHAVLRRLDRGAAAATPPAFWAGGPPHRRSVAILFGDVEGYTRLMRADEAGTLQALSRLFAGVIHPAVAGSGGRVVKTLGDGFLAEFASVGCALAAAALIQAELATSRGAAAGLQLRIAIHFDRVMVTADGDLFGAGVNLAARLQALAKPGGIVLSEPARQALPPSDAFSLDDLGLHALKNIAEPVRAFAVTEVTEVPRRPRRSRQLPAGAVLPQSPAEDTQARLGA